MVTSEIKMLDHGNCGNAISIFMRSVSVGNSEDISSHDIDRRHQGKC